MGIRLNIGCGPIKPEGWINIDNSNRAKLASHLPWLDKLLVTFHVLKPTEFDGKTRTVDVSSRLPFDDSSVDAVYSGELLEHLTREQGRCFLHECYRVLRPGGMLRVRVPDNYRFWKNYTLAFESIYQDGRKKWRDDHTRWIQMFFDDICVHRPWFKSMTHYHKWMYDEVGLILAFEQTGFVEVERKAFHESRIRDVELVETREDLNVEGIKPCKSFL